MNTGLFRTWYLPAAAALVAVFVGLWLAGGISLGRGPQGDVAYLLWTGWVALALYLVVVAYVARKYVHRVKRPRTAAELRPVQDKLERVASDLKQIEREILSGVLRSRKDVDQRAQALLAREGVRKLLRVSVEPGPPGGPPFVLERTPTEPAGRVIVWLHAHLYLGVAAALIVLLHGGLVFTTPMGFLLNVLSVVVTATGALGTYWWAVGPRQLTRAEEKLTIEEAYALSQHFARKIRELLEEPKRDPEKEPDKAYEKNKPVWDELIKLQPEIRRLRGRPLSADEATRVLASVRAEDDKVAGQQRDLLVLACQREMAERELRRLSKVRSRMDSWRVVHVPASIVLVGLLFVHVLTVWWY